MSAKTEYVFLSGKVKFCRTQTPDQFNKWGVVLYPDEPSMAKVHKLKEEGIKNVLKKDDEGYHMTFSRPTSKLIRGKVVGLAPPEVLGKDGTTPLKELVGNGSDITLKLECYGGKTPVGGTYKAARLLSIRVDNLVPFQKDSFNQEQLKQISGLAEQPEPLF